MATLSSNGSYYRIQDNITRNNDRLSQSMQRLSSGQKNVSQSRPGDIAIVNSLKAATSAMQYGENNARTSVAALEIAVADLQRLSDIITRLYEMHSVSKSSFATDDDKVMLGEESKFLKDEAATIGTKVVYKGKRMTAGVGATTNIEIGGGALTTSLQIGIAFGTTPGLTTTKAAMSNGSASTLLTNDKLAIDRHRMKASSAYNVAAWGALHATNSVSAAKQELSFYQDVDFASETSELAKHQIIAQAGTAMLAQANAQSQGILALLQT